MYKVTRIDGSACDTVQVPRVTQAYKLMRHWLREGWIVAVQAPIPTKW